jgi:hypothetical protein
MKDNTYTVTRCGEEWGGLTLLQAMDKVGHLAKCYGHGSRRDGTRAIIWRGEEQVGYEEQFVAYMTAYNHNHGLPPYVEEVK